MKTLAAVLTLFSLSIAANANPPASPPDHPTGMGAGMSKSDAPTKKGKVLSSVEAKSFTYIEVQDGSKKLWVVSPTVAVKTGNTISYADAPVQPKYHSASLNREFTNVVFTTRVVVDK
ncbi:MAG: hypothetical protein D4S02_06120 [Rhodocyclaceae bacterium]|nr:MAG: hypothetical protein D4S02_06120 [Rhodocyclaceae bacterium]